MAWKPKRRTAIVVGAGVGGVASAARLAKAGFDVTVIEKNDFTGGRCSLIHHEGFRFDQGPSLLLLPKLFQETFFDLGTSMPAEGIELLKCTPNYNVWFADGESFELSTDTSVMKREIERYEGKDGFQRYLAWFSEAHVHYELSVTEVLHRNFGSYLDLTRWNFVKNGIPLHPFDSIYARASKYFWTERLRKVFTFGAMYMGMSPFDAPGTYSLLQYTELAEGIWYPVGGFHAVVEALVRIGEGMGVKYRLSTPVECVLTSEDGKTATGVRLASGEEMKADVVVVNADLVYAYNNLFTPKTASKPTKPSSYPSKYAASLSQRAGSCSSLSFYWSLSETIPALKTHNIFLADAYRESFDSIFKDQSIPDEPSFYVNVPSRVDPSAAPEGCDAIVVLVPIGHLLHSKTNASSHDPANLSSGEKAPASGKGLDINTPADLDRMISLARSTILKTISKSLNIPSLAPLIKHEILNTPLTWEERFNLDKGSILGLSHSFFNVLAFRPRVKHNSVKNCYFVGASTHPGTGVPIVLAGAKMTVESILDDLKISRPWDHEKWEKEVNDSGIKQGVETKDVDVLVGGGFGMTLIVFLALLVVMLGASWERREMILGFMKGF